MSDNGTSAQPLYRQVAAHIAEEIESGIRPVNSKISSERELAEELGISRMTARAAINTLVLQGLVIRRGRTGAYVSRPKFRFDLSSPSGLHEQLQKAGVEPGAKIISAEKILGSHVDNEIMTALALSEQDEVYRIIRLRTANEEPIVIENSYFSAKRFPDLLDFNLADSIYGILSKYFSVTPAGSHQEMEISYLGTQWAGLMGIAADLPTLEIKRYTVTTDNTPIEFAHDIYRGDRITFIAKTGPTLNLGT